MTERRRSNKATVVVVGRRRNGIKVGCEFMPGLDRCRWLSGIWVSHLSADWSSHRRSTLGAAGGRSIIHDATYPDARNGSYCFCSASHLHSGPRQAVPSRPDTHCVAVRPGASLAGTINTTIMKRRKRTGRRLTLVATHSVVRSTGKAKVLRTTLYFGEKEAVSPATACKIPSESIMLRSLKSQIHTLHASFQGRNHCKKTHVEIGAEPMDSR